jgi:Holliday junction resolvase
MLKGSLYKDMIRVILQKSGYSVYPYGYESTLSELKSKLTQETRNSKTGRRIRSSPDLLVYDDQNVMLVEVKMRGKSPPLIRASEIKNVKEFWNDSVLVVVVPEGNIFYAQRISELEIQESDYYQLSNFERFQDIFTRVQSEDISYYKDIALQNMKSTRAMKSSPFYKNVEQKKTYNVAEIRLSDARAYKKWTDAEDLELSNNYREGFSTSQLAERHKRRRGAISSRLRKLGLIQ